MIRLDGVSKTYPDGTIAVHELSLDVSRGELVVLVGPSGCGKTTTMKMVNRLIEPTSGRIVVDGREVMSVDPVRLRRGIGYVIQNVGLFPHRTIVDNIAVVPELIGWPATRRRRRAYELMELVGLDPEVHGPRYPHELSGGQRQRVGVARALAADPPVLLMDEPFSAVDPVVRTQLQDEFLRLQADVRKTILFVTHHIEEAVRLGDRIAVFKQGGRLEQFDTPAAILGAPATPFVADFVGADRGLKRLSVTPITSADLEYPPVVHLDDSLATAGLKMGSHRWAVVLDSAGGLAGWVGQDMISGSGVPSPGVSGGCGATSSDAPGSDAPSPGISSTGGAIEGHATRPASPVRDHARRMEAWVKLDDSLKAAFAEMLQWDAGWIAVLDDDRYVGVLTPATLHTALRRSVEADAQDVERAEVILETVQDA